MDMRFPIKGIDLSLAFSNQRPGTTPEGVNVRAYEPGTQRIRGGQRCGLSRYLASQPNGVTRYQELASLVTISSPGGDVQSTSSGRVVTLVAVASGTVYVVNSGDDSWTTRQNTCGSSPAMTTGVIVRSAPNNQRLYLVDGLKYRYFSPATNTVEAWTASTAGTIPAQGTNLARLIATWRGRTVVSGILTDPQNWFMSKVADPHDWNYAPTSPSGSQAVAGNSSEMGLIGDVVTALIPWGDDTLIVGGDHTIWRFTGDPADGGRIDLVSDSIGMAWGAPWCKGPDLTLYFVSNRTGIYAMKKGEPPVRISQAIDPLLTDIDTGLYTIRLLWDDRFQGLHVFITKTSAAAATTHYFLEVRTGAWWQDVFGNKDHNPLCCCVFDGNEASDRVSLIGSWDGYVRAVDPTAEDDDGWPIESSVVLGPILTRNMDDMMLKAIQTHLGADSGDVAYEIFVGETAEIALSTDAVSTGVLSAGRNLSRLIRRSGHAIWQRISAVVPWAHEQTRATITGKGSVRRRGR